MSGISVKKKDRTEEIEIANDIAARTGTGDSAGPDDGGIRARVHNVIDSVVASDQNWSDVFLVDLVVRGHAGTRVVEIYVDGDDALPIERIAQLGRTLGAAFESEPTILDGAYRLEVSSPGISRALKLERQYPKNVGRHLVIRRKPEDGGKISGTLTAVDETGIELETSEGRINVLFNQIVEGKVALPW